MTTVETWAVILLLGVGTFVLRFSFLGMIGGRPMPEWVLRHLRYTPVAVLPALVAPAVVWPAATGGETDPARLLAAFATVAIGLATRNALWSILGGALTLYGALWLLG
ncbi:AzlD domain-containing protein [Frigidibacter mobilis]|uniref:Branched-chain amino acid transport family protein n=1 Tax=Frigidibacter mobilis TaxID=1335048 RepID=A0A159Z0I3_9RHOB|nr:AzlD domain-containing protein [Frigidibacter mobilis]AMY67408.1 branched-chain amino acid transport family protein [Frigidibacter mobilis]